MNAALIRETAAWAFWRLTMAAVILVALAAAASAQYCTPDQCDECDLNNCQLSCCHELPELWLVNTRCAPKCNNLDAGFDRLGQFGAIIGVAGGFGRGGGDSRAEGQRGVDEGEGADGSIASGLCKRSHGEGPSLGGSG